MAGKLLLYLIPFTKGRDGEDIAVHSLITRIQDKQERAPTNLLFFDIPYALEASQPDVLPVTRRNAFMRGIRPYCMSYELQKKQLSPLPETVATVLIEHVQERTAVSQRVASLIYATVASQHMQEGLTACMRQRNIPVQF